MWKEKKPKVKYFRIFGSKCYILKDRENVGKFDARSNEGIFLEYSTSSRAYRVYNNRTKTVMESCNVTVDDEVSDKKVEIDFGKQNEVNTTSPEGVEEPTIQDIVPSSPQMTTSDVSSSSMMSTSLMSSPSPLIHPMIQSSPSRELCGESCPEETYLSSKSEGFIKLKKGAEQLESLPHTTHCKEIARERGLWFIFLVLRFCIKIFQIILGAILGKWGGQNFFFFLVFHGVICKYFGRA